MASPLTESLFTTRDPVAKDVRAAMPRRSHQGRRVRPYTDAVRTMPPICAGSLARVARRAAQPKAIPRREDKPSTTTDWVPRRWMRRPATAGSSPDPRRTWRDGQSRLPALTSPRTPCLPAGQRQHHAAEGRWRRRHHQRIAGEVLDATDLDRPADFRHQQCTRRSQHKYAPPRPPDRTESHPTRSSLTMRCQQGDPAFTRRMPPHASAGLSRGPRPSSAIASRSAGRPADRHIADEYPCASSRQQQPTPTGPSPRPKPPVSPSRSRNHATSLSAERGEHRPSGRCPSEPRHRLQAGGKAHMLRIAGGLNSRRRHLIG